MKRIKNVCAFLLLGLSTASFAEIEMDAEQEELKTIVYKGSSYRYVDFDTVQSSFTASVTCGKTMEEVKEKAAQLELLVAKKWALLVRGSALAKFDSTLNDSRIDPFDPVVDNHMVTVENEQRPVIFDVCTGETLDYHEAREARYQQFFTMVVTLPLSLANEAETLVRRSELEAKSIENATLTCNTGTPFVKQVSDETTKRVQIEIEAEAREKAEVQFASDAISYDFRIQDHVNFSMHSPLESRFGNIQEGFRDPRITFSSNGAGEREAKIEFVENFKVSTTECARSSKDQKNYSHKSTQDVNVPVSAIARKGIFANLYVGGSKSCFASEEEARNALQSVSEDILNDLRAIHSNSDAETNLIVGGRVSAQEDTSFVDLQGKSGKSSDGRYYHPCDPKTIYPGSSAYRDVSDKNRKKFFFAQFGHTIKSPEVDLLGSLAKKYQQNPQVLLTAKDYKSKVSGPVMDLKQSVKDEYVSKMQLDARNMLNDRQNSPFWRKNRDKCFESICVVDDEAAGKTRNVYQTTARSADASAYKSGNDAESAVRINADEEGKKLLYGTYLISYKTRWTLMEP